MTVSAASRIQTYPAATGTGPFSYSFPVAVTNLLVPYIRVTKVAVDGTRTTLSYPADYSFTLVQNGAGGGTITPLVAFAGETLVIEANTPLTQEIPYRNEGDFYPEKHEASFDKLTFINQESQGALNRSLKLVPETSFVGDLLIDNLVGDSVLAVNSAATRIIMGPTVGEISNAAANALLAKNWATLTSGTVDGSDYSSKEYAIGIQRRGLAGGGSAKDWATYMGGPVDDTLYSARYYTDQAYTYSQQAIAAAAGMKYRDVRIATTANDTLSGLAARDGVTPVAGDRVLVKNQTTPSQNGIYVAAAGAWARAIDMDTWAEIPGSVVVIGEGSTLADTVWLCTSNYGGTLGTTAVTFVSWASAILDGTLSLAKLAAIGANTIIMNATGSSAVPTAVTFGANTFPARSSTGNLAAKVITDFGLSLVDDADASAALTTLGVTTFIKTLLDDTDAATARTTLGLGTMAVENSGLTSYTPVVTSETGSVTAYTINNAKYRQTGKVVEIKVDFTITTIGTAGGGILCSLPFTATGRNLLPAREEGVTGNALTASIGAISSTQIQFRKYDATFLGANNYRYVATGWYEAL